MRGIIPLDSFHVPARLARTVRTTPFTVRVNRDFEGVIEGCAEPKRDRARTWINGRIRRIYRAPYAHGHCHSVEVYDGDELVGGLYGVSLGRAFFGESMFHRARDASKIALVHLIARLKAGGYRLLDTQFVTDHLRTFGAVEVPKRRYHRLLEEALVGEARFRRAAARPPGERRRRAGDYRQRLAQRRQEARLLLRARRRLRLRLRGGFGAGCLRLPAALGGTSATAGFLPPLQSVSHTS